MAWSVLARGLFAAAIISTSVALRPISPSPLVNAAFGAAIAALIIFLGSRVREVVATRVAGALIGGVMGFGFGAILASALVAWPRFGPSGDFVESLLVTALTYVGLMVGARNGDWLH